MESIKQDNTEETHGSTVDDLLKAAAQEFADRGYEGTRIHNIVKRAKLTTGAVYRHFKNKNELLHAAIVSVASSRRLDTLKMSGYSKVSEVLQDAGILNYAMDVQDNIVLEALVCARRVPEIAASVKEGHRVWSESIQPLIQQGFEDGSLDPELDPEALTAFFRIIGIGSMLYLSAGLPLPEQEKWRAIISRIGESLSVRDTHTL